MGIKLTFSTFATLGLLAMALHTGGCGVEDAIKEAGKQAGKQRGGGDSGSDAADNDQKSGGKAKQAQEQANAQGPELDGVVCDAANDGVGWCADDLSIVFCADAEWWLLDCTAIEPDAYCGYDDALNEVDCFVDVEECLVDDEACSVDADCCSDFCGDDGFCGVAESCSEIDEACADDTDCCGDGLCFDGFCE